MEKVIKLNNTSPCVTYWKEEKTGNPARNEDGSIKYDIVPGGEGLLYILVDMRNKLDGNYGVNNLLHYLKNVKVTYEKFEKRIEFDSDESKYSGPDEEGYYHPGNYIGETPHWNWIVNNPEYYTDEERSGVPYYWGNDFYDAESYKDITKIWDCSKYITESIEGNVSRIIDKGIPDIYSTPEVIEVLEKWKEALERWNNPEERQKMIEEYEKDHPKEKKKFLGLF